MLANIGSESPMTDTSPERNLNLVVGYGIPHSSRHSYTNKQHLRSFLESTYRQFTRGNSNASQYVSAQRVTADVIQWLDRNKRNLPPARILYSEGEEVIIWKLAGPGDEMAARNFGQMFQNACIAGRIGASQLWSVGSSRFQRRDISKEPDDGYKPLYTRPGINDRPTIVIEVGSSHSLSQLRVEAHQWLTKTNDEVRIALLLHVNQNAKTIRLERWEMAARRLLRGQNTYRPTMVQHIIMSVSNAGVPMVVGGPLVLAIDKLFDRRPTQVPAGNLTITTQELQVYVSTYFQASQ